MLLVAAYGFVMLFGFLSGMLCEGLIGSENPAAGVLADVIVWFGVIGGISPLIPLTTMLLIPEQKRTACWWIIRVTPFVLLAVQMALAAVAECL